MGNRLVEYADTTTCVRMPSVGLDIEINERSAATIDPVIYGQEMNLKLF